jgi:hypothetical protein
MAGFHRGLLAVAAPGQAFGAGGDPGVSGAPRDSASATVAVACTFSNRGEAAAARPAPESPQAQRVRATLGSSAMQPRTQREEIPMHTCKRNLLALAIAALLAPAVALADKPAGTGHGNAASPPSSMPTTGGGRDPMDRNPQPNRDKSHERASDADDVNDNDDDDANDGDDDNSGGTGSGQSSTSAAQTNPGKGNWWADVDGDHDDRISRAEATGNAGLDSHFASVDTDGDGYVTRDEYKAYYQATVSQGAEHAQDHSAVVTADVWRRFDANGDGSLSAAEIQADARLSGDFGSIDANHDGYVSNDEYRAFYRGD